MMRLQSFSKSLRASFAVLSLAAFSSGALAFEGDVSFSAAEVQRHQAGLSTILGEAVKCLQKDLDYHHDFHERYGLAGFYGDRSEYGRMTRNQRRQHLVSLGKNPDLVDYIKPTSCVGLTLKCLGAGFARAGQADIWAKVEAFTKANAVDGTAMQLALQKLGWRVVFWNPNIAKNAEWDAKEKAADPTNRLRFWGYHAYRWSTIQSRGMYYQNPVDDFSSMINFGTRVPGKFKDVPFFVGTAHTGYHVFPGTYGQVIEGHSTRHITDYYTLESSQFNPNRDGGGPRGEYRSGLFAIPPGYGY